MKAQNRHHHDVTMDILATMISLQDSPEDEEDIADFEKSIDSAVLDRNKRLEQEVRLALGTYGVATGNWGPSNRFCEMI